MPCAWTMHGHYDVIRSVSTARYGKRHAPNLDAGRSVSGVFDTENRFPPHALLTYVLVSFTVGKKYPALLRGGAHAGYNHDLQQ